jgi:hypothetical protein
MVSEKVHVPLRVFITHSKRPVNEWYVLLALLKSKKDYTIYDLLDNACSSLGLCKPKRVDDLVLKKLFYFKVRNKKKLLLAKLKYSF